MAASVGMLLFFHAALLAWSGYVHSPTVDEMSHLSAGLSYWQFGTFGLYPVNPPLVKCVAALPVLVADPKVDWTYLGVQPLLRAERNVGRDFVRANGRRSWWYLVLGRWACIPLSLLGGYICYRWACELHGQFAGLLAVTLWCFSPNILGNGSLITSDVGAASLGVAGCYAFWCWLCT